TSYTFTGLTNGVEYTFFVSAVNGVGAGEWVQVKAAPEAPPKPTFTVTVNDSHAAASGAGSYAEGEIITINAGDRVNYNFSGWTSPDGVTFADAKSAATTFIMPAKNVTVIATWTYIEESEGGGPDTPSTPTYQANIISGTGTEETLQVSINGDIGTIVIEEEPWYGRPQDNVIIEIPPIPDVGTYSVDIPVQDLSRTDIQGTLTLNTEVGSITITSNMLEGIAETAGDKAQINIGQGDKSSLPEEVRDKVGDRPLIQLNLLIDGKQTQWSNPNAPVMVSIPYTPADEELANPEGIVVWYIDGAGNVVTIHNGRYDPETGMVTFYTTHFSDFAVVYNKASFNDVPEDAWYYKAVSFIAARGITQGTGNGNFSPASKLTRAECLVMMMRTYGIDPDTNPADNFSDAGDTYYTGYLAAAKRLGISSGVGNNMFAPGKEITRQEMFTMLYNTLKVIRQLPQGDSGKTLLDFSDASEIASWAEEAMTILVETGLIRGSGGMLAPTSTATRAEMAQLMYNLLIR
ncbi:MAG TPA: beta-xylosidase, partial [Clostridiaceae bacterium]|nr:beta-xylosidase [Clostridiaceae bacterium]